MSELLKKIIRSKHYYTDKRGKGHFVFMKSICPTVRIDNDDVKELEEMGYSNLIMDEENQFVVTCSNESIEKEFVLLASSEEDAIETAKECVSEYIDIYSANEMLYSVRKYDRIIDGDDYSAFDIEKPKFAGKITIIEDGGTSTKYVTEEKPHEEILEEIRNALPDKKIKKGVIIVFDGTVYDVPSFAIRCVDNDERMVPLL